MHFWHILCEIKLTDTDSVIVINLIVRVLIQLLPSLYKQLSLELKDVFNSVILYKYLNKQYEILYCGVYIVTVGFIVELVKICYLLFLSINRHLCFQLIWNHNTIDACTWKSVLYASKTLYSLECCFNGERFFGTVNELCSKTTVGNAPKWMYRKDW